MKILITEKQHNYLETTQWVRRRIEGIDKIFSTALEYANEGFNPNKYRQETWSDNALRMFLSDVSQHYYLYNQQEELKKIVKVLKDIYYPKIKDRWVELNSYSNGKNKKNI